MADAASARNENHPRRRDFRHLHGVVPSARRHDFIIDCLFIAELPGDTQQALVQRHRILFADIQNFDADAAVVGQSPRRAV